MTFVAHNCVNTHTVGETPLAYFVVGIIELFFLILLYAIIKRSRHLASKGVRLAANLLVIPVYQSVLEYILFVGALVCVINIFNIHPTNVYIVCVKWFLYRTVAEGLAVNLMHNGVGSRALWNSLLAGVSWGVVSSVLPTLVFVWAGFQSYAILVLILSVLLLVFYLVNWLCPRRYLHRRPAMLAYSRFYTVTVTCLIAVMLMLVYDEDGSGSCFAETALLVLDLVQPFMMFYALQDDSLYWQGLYDQDPNGINSPLLGIWDLGRETIGLVTDSIASMEKKVVKVIPFGTISLDSSRFFSGGTARVYKGTYRDEEVAVKILFCLELTPERIVNFCNEASLLHSLQHPNVVSCLGVSVMPPAICLVTEFCRFGSLYDFLHSTQFSWDVERGVVYRAAESGVEEDLDGDGCSEGSGELQSPVGQTSFRRRGGEIGILVANVREAVARSDAGGVGLSLPKTSSLTRPLLSEEGSIESGGDAAAAAGVSDGALEREASISSVSLSHRMQSIDEDYKTQLRGSASINESSMGGRTTGRRNRFRIEALQDAIKSSGIFDEYFAQRGSRTRASTASSFRQGQDSQRSSAVRGRPSDNSGGVAAGNSNTNSGTVRPLLRKLRSAASIFQSSSMGYGMGPAGANITQEPHLMKMSGGRQSLSNSAHLSGGSHGSHGSRPRSNTGNRARLRSSIDSKAAAVPLSELLPTTLRLQMSMDCCSGLSYLHQKGILHADIKSLNFLVTRDLVVKLADLGEARLIRVRPSAQSPSAPAERGATDVAPDTDHLTTGTDMLPKNGNWTAPEILANNHDKITEKSDVWSLAMVIYEILSGEVPFDDPEATAAGAIPELAAFCNELAKGKRPPLPPHLVEDPDLQWIVGMMERAWEYDADSRCAAEELLATISSHLVDLTAPAPGAATIVCGLNNDQNV